MNCIIKLSTVVLALCFAMQCNSQNIKIADFLQLRGKNKEAIETALNTFDIYLYDATELNNGRTQFSFQNETAEALNFHWIDFLYLKDAQWNNRLSFLVQEKETAKKYVAEMKNLGFKFFNKKIVDRRIYDVYTDGENTIELISSQIKNIDMAVPCYVFVFYNASEYQYAFADENKICSVPPSKKNNLFDN